MTLRFNTRLRDYREQLGLQKNEIASRIGISESYYNLFENGKREPSKMFLEKLTVFSKLPEEYWLYGIEEKEYLETKTVMTNITNAVNSMLELGFITAKEDIDNLFKDYKGTTAEEFFIAAIKSDLSYLLKKK